MKDKTVTDFDIAVLGGGVVGMTAALALAKEGLQVALIEMQHNFDFEPLTNDQPYYGQTFSIHPLMIQVFKNLGVWSKLNLDRVCAFQAMEVWDKHLDAKIRFDAQEVGQPYLAAIIEQSNLLAALSQVVKAFPEITILENTKVESIQVSEGNGSLKVYFDSQKTINISLMVGADGANSWLRNFLKIPVSKINYDQIALVGILKTELSHQNCAFQRFANTGPLALLPLPQQQGNHLVSMVWSLDTEIAHQYSQLTNEELTKKLSFETEGCLGHIEIFSKIGTIPLQGMHAKEYFKSRCVLVGDCAHRIHPLAGLGVNLGLLDVATLTDIIAKAKSKKRDIGHDSVLIRYQQNRWVSNQTVLRAMSIFKQGFQIEQPFGKTIQALGLNWVNKSHFLKKLFMKVNLGASALPKLTCSDY